MINICLNEKLKNTLKVNKLDVQDYTPAYNGESAGLDLFNTHETDITLYPSSHDSMSKNEKINNVLIPTGLRIKVPKGYVALIQERGSIIKTPLKVRAGVIDAGYTGEIFVNCINTNNKPHRIYKDNKLPFQLIVVKCDNDFKVVSEDEYLSLSNNSSRKEGKVGSSD